MSTPSPVPRVLFTIMAALCVSNAESHNPITTTVRYTREVARILNAKCVVCHSDGGMAIALQRYDQVRPWAESIKEEVLARRMPPWPAERGYGDFSNDTGLSPRELEFLISWVDGGAPEGDGQPPPFTDHSTHWMLGTPDATFVADSTLANDPRSPTIYTVDLPFDASVALRAFDLRVKDKHARAASLSIAQTGQYLGGWTPLQTSTTFPAPSAFLLPAGTQLRIEVLGSSPTDDAPPPELGVYLATDSPEPISTLIVRGQRDANGRARIAERVSAPITIIGFKIAIADGGEAVELNAQNLDGSFVPLALIRRVQSDWPTPFMLRRPTALPAGSTLRAAGLFAPGAHSTPNDLIIELLVAGATQLELPEAGHNQHSHH